ncbi:MAG: hypothetical protein ABI668_02830 [Sphingorhabdus sp.]
MATAATDTPKSTTQKSGTRKTPGQSRTAAKSRTANGKSTRGLEGSQVRRKKSGRSRTENWSMPHIPAWVGITASVVTAGLAAGYVAWKHHQSGNSWADDFSAAFSDGETDAENFDQTRNAGRSAMRDHPGDDWEDVDAMADASFPASDPPSFNPGTA